MTDPLLPHPEAVPEVPVGIWRNEPATTGRVLVAGELLSADRTRALAGKLIRAADQLDGWLA